MRIALRNSLIGVASIFCFACAHKDVVRPERVPAEATYVPGGKLGGWWQECTRGDIAAGVHCRIWNGAGLILADEEFLPYDGGPTPTKEELKVSTDPNVPGGPDRVFLTNGRVLLPKSRFDELKKFVDWLNGKRSTPQ